MAINSITNAGSNSVKFNYSALKTTTNKNFTEVEKGFSEKVADDESSSDDGSFESMLRSLLGGNSKTNKVTNPHADYKPAEFSADDTSAYQQLTEGGINFGKFYTKTKYQKFSKKAKEFEEFLRKLLNLAKLNNEGAKYAISAIQGFLDEAQKTSSSAEETLNKLIAGMENWIKVYDPKGPKGDPFTVAADFMVDFLSRTKNEAGQEKIDNISRYADKSKRFDNDKSEQDFYDVVTDKVKQKNPYDPTKSTKKYVKNKKRQEEVDEKIQEIVKLRPGVERASANEEISKLVNDISNMDSINANENGYIFNFEKLNRSIQSKSPAIA